MTHLLQMAQKVEALTGPSWQVDHEIFAVLHGWSYPLHGAALYDFEVAALETGLTNPTRSVDAAMALVPEGWTFGNLTQSDNKGWWCELRQGFLTSYDKVAFGSQLENASPALAVCAAALRARAVVVSVKER